MNSNRHNFERQTGFSLMEAVVVIAISGIIIAAVALFIRAPVTGYVDTALRAELTDIADTALRRIGRDLRTALPNSIRVTSVGSVFFLEYLEVRTGGRYRADTSGGATAPVCPSDDTRVTDNDILSFYQSGSGTDTCFKTLGNIPNRAQIVNTDFVVVVNLGNLGADAYETGNVTGGNKAKINTLPTTSGGEDRFDFQANTFRLAFPGSRFHVISGPVSYVCTPDPVNPVNGTLRRYWGYAIAASQPTPPAGGSNALLASNISACSFNYNPAVNPVVARDGLVTMSLSVTEANSQGKNETVTLYEAAHVSNVP